MRYSSLLKHSTWHAFVLITSSHARSSLPASCASTFRPLQPLPRVECGHGFVIPSNRILLLDLVDPDDPILARECLVYSHRSAGVFSLEMRRTENVQCRAGGRDLLPANSVLGWMATIQLSKPEGVSMYQALRYAEEVPVVAHLIHK